MMYMALSSLTSSQFFLVNKLSKIDINSCSSLDDTPSDEGLKYFELMKDIQKYLMQI